MKVSVKKMLSATGLHLNYVFSKLFALLLFLLQRMWPIPPIIMMLTTPSLRFSGTTSMLKSECWRGLIPTLS